MDRTDFSHEYSEATRLMGDRRTDLAALARAVSYLYLKAPEPYATGFASLLEQIERRRLILELRPPLS